MVMKSGVNMTPKEGRFTLGPMMVMNCFLKTMNREEPADL